MQPSHLALAGVLLAGGGLLLRDAGPSTSSNSPASSAPAAMPAPPPPLADGHYVLVVEGDRNGLKVTHASRKQDPWAGVPKGFTSNWRLVVLDAADRMLAEVPLDVSAFDTSPAAVGKPLRVEGCEVRDSRIGMLVNAPRFDAAASYRFERRDAGGDEPVVLGTYDAALVRRLAEDVR